MSTPICPEKLMYYSNLRTYIYIYQLNFKGTLKCCILLCNRKSGKNIYIAYVTDVYTSIYIDIS